MLDFTKLAAYLDNFTQDDPGYDTVCYIKSKIAQDLQDPKTINNANDEELDDNEVTMSTGEQRAQDNAEGEIMSGAFKELDVLNKIKEEKDEVVMPGKEKHKDPNMADTSNFGNNAANQKNASLFDLLAKKIKR